MPDDEKQEEVSGEPLTAAENRRVREMLIAEAHAEWAWKTFRRWVGWGSGIVVAIYASWDFIMRFLSALQHAFMREGPP